MPYKQDQFNNCIFNPMVSGKMLQEYPRLNEIIVPEWTKDNKLDFIIRYVILVYDSKSPLQRDEKELLRRKSVAADLAGFNLNNREYMEKIYDGSNEVCFAVITRYLIRYIKDKEFAALCAFEFKYYENIGELLTPIIGTTNAERLDAARKKSVISDEIDKDIKRIDDYWEQLYGDKEIVKQVKSKKFTPERYLSNV